MDTINDFFAARPALFALAFTVAIPIVIYLWASLKWFVVREAKRMDEREQSQDERINHMDVRLHKHEVDKARTDERVKNLCGLVEDHIEKEDERTRTVAGIATSVARIEGILKRNGGR